MSLVLTGLATGAIYSIMGSGLVLTYTTSGIFNFAHGAIAFTVAYLYYQLHSGGMPLVPALIISVFIFAPLLGLLLDRVLLRRLSKAPVYARIVGTIGLLVALPSIAQWLVVTVGNSVLHLNWKGNAPITSGVTVPGIGPFPSYYVHVLNGVAIETDNLVVLAAAAITAFSLWFLLRHTRVGLQMRAVVDRDALAGLRGINAPRMSAIAWILTMILAGLGGVLIAPLFSLDPTVLTIVALSSLAAVVLGGLRSLPITFAAGLALGVIQNLVAGYSPQWLLNNLAGYSSSIPFVLVLVVGLLIGRDRSRRAGTVADDKAPEDHRVGLSPLRRRLPWIVLTVVLAAFALHWFHIPGLQADSYAQSVIAQSLAMAIIFLSLVVITGIGGMVSFAQATFVTVAGFGTGWALAHNWGFSFPLIASGGHLNFLWAAVLGTLIAGLLGVLFAIPSVRLGPVYLAIWTLAIAFFFSLLVFAWHPIGHGDAGWTITGATLHLPGFDWVHHLLTGESGPFDFNNVPDQILLFFVVFGLCVLVIHNLQRSSTGRSMLAVRSSQVAAEASGIRANRTRVVIFGISAAIAGLGGVMLTTFTFGMSTQTAQPYVGMVWLVLVISFGIRRPGGAFLAGLAFVAGTPVLNWISTSFLPSGTISALIGSIYFLPMLFGMSAIGLAQEPDGLLSMMGQRKLKKRRAAERQTHLAEVEAAAHDGQVPEHERSHAGMALHQEAVDESAALVLSGIVASYGSVEVLHGVSLALPAGKVVALLGANGAGKSTVCAVASGLLAPLQGSVVFQGEDVTSHVPHQMARSGVQLIPEARGIFPGLTVEENLSIVLRSDKERDDAYERFPILSERRKQAAGLLSGGEQQMLSLVPALVNPPAVFMADEPTLGLSPIIAEQVVDAIGELRDRGTAVLLVEESATNAMIVADTVVFMQLGSIVWSGPREEADMEQLRSAYLGGAGAS